MKPTFKINGQEYGFKDITLRTYYSLKQILAKKETKNSEFEIVECLTGCPTKDLKRLQFSDWLLVWEEANMQISTLSGGDTNSIRPTIEFEGVKYGLPAVEDITIGEFADLDIIVAGSKTEEKMNEIAAVLYRPILKQKGTKITLEPYDTEGFEIRKDLFMDMPITAIKSANAFFLQSANSLLRSTAESLLRKTKKQNSISPDVQAKLEQVLLQDPGGEFSIQLQEEILLSLKGQPSSRFAQLSTGLRGKKTKFANIIWPFRRKQNTL